MPTATPREGTRSSSAPLLTEYLVPFANSSSIRTGSPAGPERAPSFIPSAGKTEIVVLGYDSKRIQGGVTVVTDILLRNFPSMRLHPVKHCYQPATLDAWLYLRSLMRFLGVLARRRHKLLVHMIVASRGDRIRAIPILLACALFSVPCCVQYHKNVAGLIFELGSLRDRLINRVYRLCNLHVFLSPALRNEFVSMAPKLRETRIIHNALPNSWLGLQRRPLEERKVDVVFFGRWNAEKGIDVLLEYLATRARTIRCEIYSDHVPKEGIENAVVKPWAKEEEVRTALGTARVLVLPSYLEAYPTVLLEALACGTPFVATNIGGIPDIAAESGGGILVPTGDAAALGTAIDSLLSDETAWSQRSNSGWHWVNRTCSIEQVLPLWAEAYASIHRK